MKRVISITAAVCALGAGGFALAAGLATKTVNIRSTSFAPRTVTVAGGDTVRWKNLDTVNHQVVASNGSFASGAIRPQGTYEMRMDTPGTYPYHDALKPSLKGTVRVTGLAPSISIGASLPIATYGSQVRIGGAISPPAIGDSVTVWAQPYPAASYVQVGVVQTTTNGLWDFMFVPQILTNWKATWKGKESAVVTTAVSPQLQLAKIGSWFVARARAKSFYGKYVYAQRLNRFNQWVSLRKVFLNRQSARRFKLRLPSGISRIRVFMTTNQAGDGYVFSASRVIAVRTR